MLLACPARTKPGLGPGGPVCLLETPVSNACETFLRSLAPSAGCASLHNRCAVHVQALRPRAITHAPPTPRRRLAGRGQGDAR